MPTVAIVDDALLIRMQMKKFFEDTMHFEVLAQGADGNDAVRIFENQKPDLMTLDLTMPNKSGVEAIREIIKICPDARILVVSAIKDASMITEALHLGARGFVNKPLQFASEEFVSSFKEDVEDAMAR
ncbi:MAG: response regulator [Deltaproteobacteria bacterium]|nr:response regulator [Deltaproteobacteria bacterium]